MTTISKKEVHKFLDKHPDIRQLRFQKKMLGVI